MNNSQDNTLREQAMEVLRRTKRSNLAVATMIAQGMQVFAPLGWAMSDVWPWAGVNEALEAAADGGGAAAIDMVLTDAWNGEHHRWMTWGITPLRAAANKSLPLKQVLWNRATLFEKAVKHHNEGSFEASIPILFAQIEGLSYDLVDKAFFPKKNQIPAVDDETLAGMKANIEVARPFFSADVRETQTEGSASRHGILHGRELAYDTRINSTKVICLMLSLVEHWLPIANLRAAEQRLEHEKEVTGNVGLDREGRIIDDRGHPELLDFAFWFECKYTEWINFGQSKVFRFLDELTGLAGKHGVDAARFDLHQKGRGDIWYAYQLPGGYILGWAARPNGRTNTPRHESWMWAQPTMPPNAPWENPNLPWHSAEIFPYPINWEPKLVI